MRLAQQTGEVSSKSLISIGDEGMLPMHFHPWQSARESGRVCLTRDWILRRCNLKWGIIKAESWGKQCNHVWQCHGGLLPNIGLIGSALRALNKFLECYD